jgi:hypothetical protein
MVLEALGDEWRLVGLAWHPWDLQRGSAKDRVRIQVKQTAALQLWGKTKVPTLSFKWHKEPPEYFARDNPGEAIEDAGWFCELFVFGIHSGTDPETVDQVDPQQWEFLVVPTSELERGASSMVLTKALARWTPVGWGELRGAVRVAIARA